MLFFSLTISHRCQLIRFFEQLTEITRRTESRLIGNLSYIQFRIVPQKEGCFFQPQSNKKVVWCLSGYCLDFAYILVRETSIF